MKFLIDSANGKDIDSALLMGVEGITANPSMYAKEEVNFYDFLVAMRQKTDDILTAEVMGNDIEAMRLEVDRILEISNDIVIKINFSEIGLQLVKELSRKGIKTVVTLIFNLNQAMLAINVGADYIFPFIGRNEGVGVDGLKLIKDICGVIKEKGYNTKVVAASIKNLYHLEEIAKLGADYAAVPYNLLKEACYHSLTVSGAEQFQVDWDKVDKKHNK